MNYCVINIDKFISKNVIKRDSSMFYPDIADNIENLKQQINGKSILVIGGAGSIGASFIKQILKFNPSSLVVVDINENSLAELTRDLRSTIGLNIPNDFTTYPFDYNSSEFVRMFKNRKGFDIVANFSAHKHVRTEKDIYAIEALINNNVIHLKHLLDLLVQYPPHKYFCVSTDKAANPVNVMGASKRIMEDVIFSYSNYFNVTTARFANVAFSNGSLPDGFLSRISKHQPLSAPVDVKRYFVSPEEAGQICLISCLLGDNRTILFPKLESAQMESFDKIARDLLAEYGYEIIECDTDEEALSYSNNLLSGGNLYPVRFTKSDTSGEKTFEEFVATDEQTDMNSFSSLGVIIGKEIPDSNKINDLFVDLIDAFKLEKNKDEIINIINNYLLNFHHIETGKSLDNRM